MAKNTPGPWQFKANISSIGIYDANGSSLARVPVEGKTSKPRRIADARVMAAAPELLECLRALLDEHPGTENERTVKARAAIAKAVGPELRVTRVMA